MKYSTDLMDEQHEGFELGSKQKSMQIAADLLDLLTDKQKPKINFFRFLFIMKVNK